MSKSGRWVASPTAQGATQAHSFFARPSKAAANSPLAPQGVSSHQPYSQSNGHGPITASWNNNPSGTAQHVSNAGSMPSTSSAQSAAAPPPGRWQGFTQMLSPRPRPHRYSSGPLLANVDPATLSSIPEADPGTGAVDASLPAYQSTDLDAVSAASAANQLWATSGPSPSPRHSPAASQGSSSQPGPSQGSYVVPSPWSTPAKPSQSSSASPGRYPVPSPQNNTPGGTPPQSRGQSPPAAVGPFEAAARARAAANRAGSNAPGNSSPGQAVWPVPSPATSRVQQQAHSVGTSPAGSRTGASSPSLRSPNQAGRSGSSPARDWSSAIPGMSTTKAARRRRL